MVKKIVNVWVRFGFIIRGAFYILTGFYGLIVAIGASRSTKNTVDIVKIVGSKPFGHILLVAIFLGFIGYGLWGIVRTLRKGRIIIRLGYFVSGLSYFMLSLIPLHLLLNISVGNTVNYKIWSQFLIDLPYGFVLVITLGLIVMVGGVGQIIYSIQGKFKKTLTKMGNGKKKKVLVATGEFGYIVRGIIFTLIGYFFLQSGLNGNAASTKDPGQILMWSWQQNGGPVILGTISIGFIALGVYSVMTSQMVKLIPSEKN